MREAIGGSQLLMIIVVLVIVIMMLLAGSIGYSKAFKARNAIVNIVQENGGYGISVEKMFEYGAEEQIAEVLNDMGYKTSIGSKGCNCSDIKSDVYTCLDYSNTAQYNFCVYHLEDTQTGNQLYKIKTYMYFELPIFGRNDMFAIPIYADTYSFLKYGI